MTTDVLRTPLDPDRETARDLLVRELNDPDYNRAQSLVARVLTWVEDRLNDLLGVFGGDGALANLLLAAVIAVVVVVAVIALQGRRRGLTLRQDRAGAVVEDSALTATDYRARAGAAAARQDWDQVLLDSYRALAVDAARRTVLDDVPSLTAHEIGARLARAFPDHGADLAGAADAFDGVRYGDQRAAREQAERARELDAILARATPRVETPS